MNLGMGLVAADEFFKAGDARKEREFIQAKRDAELGLLPDVTRAKRAQLGLDAATDEANAGLVPQQTEVAGLRLRAERGDLQGTIAAQPETNSTRKLEAATKLRFTQAEASDAGRKINEMAINGAISREEARQRAFVMLRTLIGQGNKNAVLSFFNSYGGAVGMPYAADVRIITDANGKEHFQAVGNGGKTIISMSRDELDAISARFAGKGDLLTVKPGETIVSTKDGKTTPLYTAPETRESKTSRMGPIERDIAYFEEKFGMTKEQALAQINSAKTQTRETFIMKQVEALNGIRPAGATDADIQRFSQMYDRIRATGGGSDLVSQQPWSNNPAPATVSPETRNILGLP